jgi:hypothetical protein
MKYLEMVKKDGYKIRYVPLGRSTPEICLAAFK